MANRYYQVPQTFSEWRQFARYTLDDCVIVFKVTPRTIKNWESGKIEPPRAVLICLQLFSCRLDFLGKDWKGFQITPDCIESPDGDFVRAHEIKALRYAMQAVGIQRDRRCRMNENQHGEIEALNASSKPFNVTCIDEAPKKEAVRRKVENQNPLKDESNALHQARNKERA